jgi:hypothetical protein
MSNPIFLDNTPEQVELIKAMASADSAKAAQAQEALAAVAGKTIQTVINKAPTISNLFKDLPFDKYSNPSLPLDLFYDVKDTEYVRVWQQSAPGGLPYSEVHGINELKFTTYELESAVAFLKKFAAQGNVNIVAKTLNRMAQEFLIKRDNNAAVTLLSALAQASTTNGGVTKKHIIRTATAGTIVLDDFLALFELNARVLAAWNGGTPVFGGDSLTDLIVSPEMVRKLRGLSFNPINTNATPVTNIPAHEKLREEIYKAAGALNFYDVAIHQMQEFGVGYAYNTLFGAAAGSTTYPGFGGGADAVFNPATQQIMVGINANIDGLWRPVATNGDKSSQVVVVPDDQFVRRQSKIGFSAGLEEGYAVLDARQLCGLIA